MSENYTRLLEEKKKQLRLWDSAYETLRKDDCALFEQIELYTNENIKKIEELAETLNKLGLLTNEETEDIKALNV